MKLNLWLIANRLSNYDIKTSISSDISRPIRNPLPVMASGSLYVHSKGNDVLCYSDQGTILIRDMDEKEGFLLIQSIFNWYDRWLEDVEAALQSGEEVKSMTERTEGEMSQTAFNQLLEAIAQLIEAKTGDAEAAAIVRSFKA